MPFVALGCASVARPRWRLTVAAVSASLALCVPSAGAAVLISATTPHRADGVDRSMVVVRVRDATGLAVTNASIELEVRAPHFMTQATQLALRRELFHRGNGEYAVTFPWPFEGPVVVIARNRTTAEAAVTIVTFLGPALLQPPVLDTPNVLADDVVALDLAGDCKKFFDELDNEFFPPILAKRAADEADRAKQAALLDRLADMTSVGGLVESEKEREKFVARGGVPNPADTALFAAAKAAAKPSFQRISDAQEMLLKKYFGASVDFNKVQSCMELFNNFGLVDDFDKAVDKFMRLRQLLADLAAEADPARRAAIAQAIQAIGRFIVNGPDASEAHIRWAKFANLAVELNVSDTLWRTMKAITSKGSAITVKVLSDNDDTKPGIQPKRQPDAVIDTLRTEYDPLRPKEGDSDAEKKRKIEEIEKKLENLFKDILGGKTLAQLPGLDGTDTLAALIVPGGCLHGQMRLTGPVTSAVALASIDGELFGFGSDNAGRAYVARGRVAGSQVDFVVQGWGMSPNVGAAITLYRGTAVNGRLTGVLEGFGTGSFGGPEDTCEWSGTFTVAPRRQADMDGDGDVDRVDVNTILTARNVPARPDDPRNLDSDPTTITVNDARVASMLCTRPLCAP